MLGELAENIAVDLHAGLRNVDGQLHLLRNNSWRDCRLSYQGATEKKCTPDERSFLPQRRKSPSKPTAKK
jgi:hypothetical protein